VADDLTAAIQVVNRPAQAPGLVAGADAGQGDLSFLHRVGGLLAQQPPAVRSRSAIQVHRGEGHRQTGGPQLGNRADLEDRFRSRLDPGRLAQQTMRGGEDLSVQPDCDRGGRHLVLGEKVRQRVLDPLPDVLQGRPFHPFFVISR
jgi:hypothetical protein